MAEEVRWYCGYATTSSICCADTGVFSPLAIYDVTFLFLEITMLFSCEKSRYEHFFLRMPPMHRIDVMEYSWLKCTTEMSLLDLTGLSWKSFPYVKMSVFRCGRSSLMQCCHNDCLSECLNNIPSNVLNNFSAPFGFTRALQTTRIRSVFICQWCLLSQQVCPW